MNLRLILLSGICIGVLLIGLLGLAVALGVPTGVLLKSKIVIKYKDGSVTTLSSDTDILRASLTKLILAISRDKAIDSLEVKVWIEYRTTNEVKTQAWYQYYISISGIYGVGLREYDPLTGFTDIFTSTYYDTKQTNRWILFFNNPFTSWTGVTDFVKYFYRESGTGLQAGLLNLGPEYAHDVVTALREHIVTRELMSQLTGLLAVDEYRDGDKQVIVDWSLTGESMYNYLKRMDWRGLAIHIGPFTIGAGEWLRMHNGDTYIIKFNLGYIYRFNILGKWTRWKSGVVTLAVMEIQIVNNEIHILNVESMKTQILLNTY